MPRNSNRSVPLSWILAFAVVVLLAGSGIYFLRSFLSDPYRTVPELPVDQYVDNSLSFRGNIYKVTGSVENEIGWSDKIGRLFSFKTQPADKPYFIAILLPSSLEGVNIQKGQHFEIKVKVVDKGLLQAVDIRKV